MDVLSAGMLNEQVTFERRGGDADEYGNEEPEWEPRLTAWANVRELLGRSAIEAGIPENTRGIKIGLRGTPESRAIDIADRCRVRGQYGAVRSVIERDHRGQIVDVLVVMGGIDT